MSKRSTIKSVEPRLDANQKHHTWQMSKGPSAGDVMYDFIVEMDNGDKGRASAKSDTFRFKAGDDVFYEHVPDEQHGDRLKSFASVERQQQYQQTTADPGTQQQVAARPDKYKEDPEKARRIVAESVLRSAVEFSVLLPEKYKTSDDILALATKFEQWVHDSLKRYPEGK